MEKHNSDAKSNSILIKQVKIVDTGSAHHNRIADIFIENGQIKQIGDLNLVADQIIDGKNCIVTPGLFDLRCRHGEPGCESNEDIESLTKVALAGGFTAVASLPDAQPPIQSRAQIEFLLNKTKDTAVKIYPLGAATLNLEGKELSEVYDMFQGGAIGFSNADSPYSSGCLQRALLYTKNFDALIFSHAEDKNLSGGGMVNESEITTHLGLKTFPAHAEYTVIAKEIEIARYTDSELHFSHISTAQSVQLIRNAKKEGLKISCDASILHLALTDEVLNHFDSNLKVMPPLRGADDRKALIEGLKDGTIDCIVSDHNPQCQENKLVEFNYSPFGAITLQVLFSLYRECLMDQLPLEVFISALSKNPRQILGLNPVHVTEGEHAELAIFDLDENWEFNHGTNQSKSMNSHLFGQKIQGRCKVVLNNGHLIFNN